MEGTKSKNDNNTCFQVTINKVHEISWHGVYTRWLACQSLYDILEHSKVAINVSIHINTNTDTTTKQDSTAVWAHVAK